MANSEPQVRVVAIELQQRIGDNVRVVRRYPVADSNEAAYLAACRKARATAHRIDAAYGRGCTGTRLVWGEA